MKPKSKNKIAISFSQKRGGNKIEYPIAKKCLEDYHKGVHRKLVFRGGKNGGQVVKGFRLDKCKVLDILNQAEDVTDLFIFLALNDDQGTTKKLPKNKKDYTIIFSAIKPYKNEPGEDYDGEICQDFLYDYVDPCPDKCPKFK
jgi:hypothetical protein